MYTSVHSNGEKVVKASIMVNLVHQTKQLSYIIYLDAAIFFYLSLQFYRRIGTICKILWKSVKYSQHTLEIPPNSFTSHIVSPTSQVFFRESRRIEIPLCLKVWQRQLIRGEVENEIPYLLEGFIRNHSFAPGVYLGFAYFKGLSDDAQTYQYGTWTLLPRKSKLATGKYTYLMKALNEEWRLDRCLYERCLFDEQVCVAEQEGMEFLAGEVARLHRLTKKSLPGKGSPEAIAQKLAFNRNFFDKAMKRLSVDGHSVSSYLTIMDAMQYSVGALAPEFRRRFEQGHIRRCHGDLKLTNLWIRPTSARHPQQRLLALDCIDFNPDFYHVDTLSDMAMLVMDLQMHLQEDRKCEALVKVFIDTYLQKMGEDEESTRSLLTYYTTEKAIVCANVSILLDNDIERGIKYLRLAQELAKGPESLMLSAAAQQASIEERAYAAQLPLLS